MDYPSKDMKWFSFEVLGIVLIRLKKRGDFIKRCCRERLSNFTLMRLLYANKIPASLIFEAGDLECVFKLWFLLNNFAQQWVLIFRERTNSVFVKPCNGDAALLTLPGKNDRANKRERAKNIFAGLFFLYVFCGVIFNLSF